MRPRGARVVKKLHLEDLSRFHTRNVMSLQVSSDVQIPVNQWVHVAARFDGYEAAIFMAGREVGKRALSRRPLGREEFTVGLNLMRTMRQILFWQLCAHAFTLLYFSSLPFPSLSLPLFVFFLSVFIVPIFCFSVILFILFFL